MYFHYSELYVTTELVLSKRTIFNNIFKHFTIKKQQHKKASDKLKAQKQELTRVYLHKRSRYLQKVGFERSSLSRFIVSSKKGCKPGSAEENGFAQRERFWKTGSKRGVQTHFGESLALFFIKVIRISFSCSEFTNLLLFKL